MNENDNKLGQWQDEQMSLVFTVVGQDTAKLCAMLNQIKPVFTITKDGNYIRAKCPRCGDNAKAKVRDRDDEKIVWRCFKCGASKELSSSLVGLVRLFTGLPMTKAANKLFDLAFNENRPSEYRLPDRIGQYSGNRLDEISPTDLFYLAKNGTAPALTAEVKKAIQSYLFANLRKEVPPQKINPLPSIPLKTERKKPAHKTRLEATPVIVSEVKPFRKSFNFNQYSH